MAPPGSIFDSKSLLRHNEKLHCPEINVVQKSAGEKHRTRKDEFKNNWSCTVRFLIGCIVFMYIRELIKLLIKLSTLI